MLRRPVVPGGRSGAAGPSAIEDGTPKSPSAGPGKKPDAAFKTSSGAFPLVDARALRRGLLAEGLQELPLAVEHCLAVQHLPWIHRDPFDRLLVAAARESGCQLITADRTLLAYGAEVMAFTDL